MSVDNQLLLLRMRSCLQTILELEESLVHSHLGPALATELQTLRQAFAQVENVLVEEDDVCRIEAATDKFLAEIKKPLGNGAQTPKPHLRLLQ